MFPVFYTWLGTLASRLASLALTVRQVKMQAARVEKVVTAATLPTAKELAESVSTIASESQRQLDALMRSSGGTVGKPSE